MKYPLVNPALLQRLIDEQLIIMGNDNTGADYMLAVSVDDLDIILEKYEAENSGEIFGRRFTAIH
jgi:hypothetical protein